MAQYETKDNVTPSRYRNACMWVAVAAMAVVSLARVQVDIGKATISAHPVLEFLAGHESAAGAVVPVARQVVHLGSARSGSMVFLHGAAPGTWMAILPVLFIGLVTPLSLVSARSIFSRGRTPSAPSLPVSFQRPPPSYL